MNMGVVGIRGWGGGWGVGGREGQNANINIGWKLISSDALRAPVRTLPVCHHQ